MAIAPANATKLRAEAVKRARFNEGVNANLEPLRNAAKESIDAAADDGQFEATIRYKFKNLRGDELEWQAQAEQVLGTMVGELESLGYQLAENRKPNAGGKRYWLQDVGGELSVRITARFG
jgi:hypothetical protein